MREHINNHATEIQLIKQLQIQQSQQISEMHKAIMGNGRKGIRAELDELRGALKMTQVIFTILGFIISVIMLIGG